MQFEKYQFPSRRSNIVARNGMVATSQPLASQAGLSVLQAGGNAIDAAIATVATLCVTEPCSTGVGGDAFALIWSAKDKKLYGLNASGPAPAGLTSAWIRDQGHESVPSLGPIPVTVPGSIRGWQLALERFGTMGLDTLLARPIHYARDGYGVSQRIGFAWNRSVDKLSSYEDSRRVWLPGGKAPAPGTIFRNPEFATTLQTLAEQGYDAFYHGDIGRQIAQSVQDAGGVLTQEDLVNYQAEWVDPIQVEYRDGYAFHEIPPNGQGLTALLALNIVKHFDLRGMGFGSAGSWHAQMEAIKLAFADAHAYIGDPRKVNVPVESLLSDAYTRSRVSMINPGSALTPTAGDPSNIGDTVYLSVADSHGNMVSWIQSLYMGFGSGVTAGTTGIQLQNRGANFTLEEGHPNEAAPGRRPFHTIIPGFITRNGEAFSSFGVMGGFMQPQGHMQVGVNMIDYDMDPQAALDAPRFQWTKGKEIGLEVAAADYVRQELLARGHELLPKGHPMGYGGGQAIVRDPETGVLVGGSEPRNDGAAVGF